jgi:hypothetical protein
LTHINYGERATTTLVTEAGERRKVAGETLAKWVTVDGLAKEKEKPNGDGIHHVEITHPAPLLENQLTIVDTPGVNDINEQRAEITYGYLPRADAAIFLLDATQILTASERQFLEERILRSSRDRLLFVVAKADLLDDKELAEALAFARLHLTAIVPEPEIFPVSAKRALAGDRAGSGLDAFTAALGATVANERRRLLLDNALADASRLTAFIRQSLAIRRRSLELPLPELEERIARAHTRLTTGKQVLSTAAETVRAETAALKARVRQDRTEQEGEKLAAELERLAETVIQVANENIRAVAADVAGELGPSETKVDIKVDTLRYDASVFALGALGTTVFLFINSLVGGMLTLAAPLLAFVLRGKVAAEIKGEAKQQAPLAVDRVAAVVGPKLDEVIDGFGARLLEFVAQAGDALARGIADVLDQALRDRRGAETEQAATGDAKRIDASLHELKRIDERIADIRQGVWTTDESIPA